MITGDPALDAWLAAHGWDIAVAVLLIAAVAMALPGLVLALAEDGDD